jgi:tRNA(Ile2) C34 agmatinyltransferase TiaS
MAATGAVEGGLMCLGYPGKSQQELKLALNRPYCEEVCGDLFEAEVELGYRCRRCVERVERVDVVTTW